jgi:two-component system chemotaxis response regulator CheB
MQKKIKVLIVDDSAIVRDALSVNLANYDDIEVLGTAPDPFIARNKIINLKPDVITLDIEMPRMDGLTFLEKLMTYYPLPVIIVSSVTTKDKYASIKALEIGAFDVVNKPSGSISVSEVIEDIYYKIKQAYQVKDFYLNRRNIIDSRITKTTIKHENNILSKIYTTDKLIAIGASTGGTVAIEFILKNLPGNMPPILIVQHMPENYTKSFADRLNELSKLKVKEAEDEEFITDGSVYIAKGGYHLELERKGANLFTKLSLSEKVQFQRPSVDVLFNSVSRTTGKNSIGLLLTGMGKDGANGLLSMKNSGALTYAQDEESSIVWGMPKAAIEIDAAVDIINLEAIPELLINYAVKKYT